jgi:NADPH-dependent 2,4-dienoyl-CoA reductase/sulfur reductase-like enzyme/ferredoxin
MPATVPFPSYTQMPSRVPDQVWAALRVAILSIVLAICLLLVIIPETGLFLVWRILVPLLPLVFFVAPGLWRNTCPLATLNQLPRLYGFTHGLGQPKWLREYSYVIGIGIFLIIVPARKALFNRDGLATALLILGALTAAFVGGVVFKGKSGWCSSLCPLLPVQRIYGQTPYVTVPNNHCRPCVGCSKNCYDFNPAVAYLADLYDQDRHYSGYRKFFAGAFPGLILAFYTVPDPPAISVPGMYLRFGLLIAASLGAFSTLDSFLKITTNKLTGLFAAAALNLYYWFNIPLLSNAFGGLLGVMVPWWVDWVGRLVVLQLSAYWVDQTYAKESLFVAQALSANPVKVGSAKVLAPPPVRAPGRQEVTIELEGKKIVVEAGRTLLEIAESDGLAIEAGCRMGMCGADPVAIREGMGNLSLPTAEERATLARLGFAGNTRMACCARVHGPVSVALKPERPSTPTVTPVTRVKVDPAIARVVIIGNGIAGVTAADHVRRQHPKCEIHIVGRERHHLYNRMGISRLIYGRSAMQGLYLVPETWYDEHRMTCWLNTRATKIDPVVRRVILGTGETLGFDRLILATGSSSLVPAIEGMGLRGSFVLREAEDAMQIRAFAQEQGGRRAVIAGGGLLGVEAAYALHKLGLHVTLLVQHEWVLRRQLDARAGAFVSKYLERLGLDIVYEVNAVAVQGDGRVQQVVLKDGRTLSCDIFLVCAGIVPNVGLAREAGLTVRHGVVVDDRLRTSVPEILAAGDIAEHRGQVYGLWPAAVQQAGIAAINAVGGDAVYKGTIPVTILKVVGIDLTSMGRVEPEAPDDTVVALEDMREQRYRKLVISQGRLAGAILLGWPLDAPAVTAAVKKQVDVTPVLEALKRGNWSVLRSLPGSQSGERFLTRPETPKGQPESLP